MTHSVYYPKADRTTENFNGAYSGSIMNPNVLVLHTTEGNSWPGYQSGSEAPNLTAFPDPASKTLHWRQHFPVNVSARALVNAPGGVETNTMNAVQIELVGTCVKGGPGMYWPEAPDWALQQLADFVRWLNTEWSAFPIKDAAVHGWLAYPASYGNSRVRLSFTEWHNAYGILGHQHVPENVHGDPGLFPIQRLLGFAAPAAPSPKPVPPTGNRVQQFHHEFDTNQVADVALLDAVVKDGGRPEVEKVRNEIVDAVKALPKDPGQSRVNKVVNQFDSVRVIDVSILDEVVKGGRDGQVKDSRDAIVAAIGNLPKS